MFSLNQSLKNKSKNKQGIILVNTIVFATIATILIIGLTAWFGVTIKSSRNLVDNEMAFQVAEAGIEYYRWHLAHDQDDYQDGTGEEGPYVHDFLDKNGNKIGEFSLNIIAPVQGNSVVTVESTGTLESNPDVSRTIRTRLAIPSLAKFAFVSDSDMRFGEGTEVFGPIHSNGGIRFDGLAHNIITSARETYDDPDHSGPNEWGVHTHISPVDPNPPTPLSNRDDVFEAGREVGVPAVDFEGIISDMSELKSLGQSSEGLYFSPSGQFGYKMVLKTNGTFDLYKVRSLEGTDSSCYDVIGQDGWGSWSIKRERSVGTYNFPENGVIFVEDDLWVEGQIDGARLTIAAGSFPDSPSRRKSITINNDLLYTNYDGTDVIALIAQKNINAGLESANDYRVDAALIAQNGRVGRYYYSGPFYYFWWYYPGCSPYHQRDTITLYGMIGSKNRYGFAYTDDTGYTNRNIIYDANLLYGPPPEFPLTADQYETISWDEI